ncbi:hypothetical protein DM02DRAFT_209496 [Periconia macrospinosa]|uniref:Uncharacterized protein n=1 Tax=Periconia macrospinosa TaxID=97972 RepID=A0A2V1E198_9PLEO|nr:hypothetical protein DM02DRAFT_209496 [Periconia macrospinosa]
MSKYCPVSRRNRPRLGSLRQSQHAQTKVLHHPPCPRSRIHLFFVIVVFHHNMPIILPTIPAGGRSPTYNLTDYSHSTVFTVTHTKPLSTLDYTVPALTTAFTAPTSCADRWVVRGKTWGPATFGGVRINAAWDIYKIGPQSHEIQDPWYEGCQAYSQVPAIYSPGMCPDGQTVAEITEHRTLGTTGTGMDSYWQASCCPSGMGFGKVKHARCQMTYATSTMAYFPMTSKVSGQSDDSTFYEATITKTVGSQSGKPVIETSKQTSVTTLAAGYAIQDPVVVAWQRNDLDLFPAAYASSLASQIGVPFTATNAAPGTTPNIPGPTGTPNSSSSNNTSHSSPQHSSELSFPAKVGVIVGSIGGLLVLCTVLICILLRQRRRRRDLTVPPHHTTNNNNDETSSKWWRTRGTDGTGAGVFGFVHSRRQMLSNSSERLELDGSSKTAMPVEMESPAPSPRPRYTEKGNSGVWARRAELEGANAGRGYCELSGEEAVKRGGK